MNFRIRQLCLLIIITCLLAGLFTLGGSNSVMIIPNDNHSLIYSTLYTDHTPIIIDGDSELLTQASLESWPGDGTIENPIIISGYNISALGSRCLTLSNLRLHWKVLNCLFGSDSQSLHTGIWINNVTNGVIQNNTIQNRYDGIDVTGGASNVHLLKNQIRNSSQKSVSVVNGIFNSVISENQIFGNGGDNIWITGGFNNSIISKNTIINGRHGIRVELAYDVLIQANSIKDTYLEGITLPLGSNVTVSNNTINGAQYPGISTCFTNSVIKFNMISNSNGPGLVFASGEHNIVEKNTFSNNTEYGLTLSSTTSNVTIIKNIFLDNNKGNCQVLDDGESNSFLYNHYNDWISPDANSDNIVDEPYAIDGEANNKDYFPLVDPNGPIPTTAVESQVDTLVIIAIGGGFIIIVFIVILKKHK